MNLQREKKDARLYTGVPERQYRQQRRLESQSRLNLFSAPTVIDDMAMSPFRHTRDLISSVFFFAFVQTAAAVICLHLRISMIGSADQCPRLPSKPWSP